MSKKYNVSMDSGNFTLSLDIEPKEEVITSLVEKGLKYELERRVLTTVYLKLCGVAGKRAGKRVLPAKFERKDLGYDEDNAATMKAAIMSEMGKLGEVSWANVGQWFASVEDSKYVDERAAMLRHETAGDLEEWLKDKVKYYGETHGEDEEYHIEALIAVRKYAKWVKANM